MIVLFVFFTKLLIVDFAETNYLGEKVLTVHSTWLHNDYTELSVRLFKFPGILTKRSLK